MWLLIQDTKQHVILDVYWLKKRGGVIIILSYKQIQIDSHVLSILGRLLVEYLVNFLLKKL